MKKWIVLVLLMISLSTRLYFLWNGMPSATHDEADFYYSGKVLATTGSDQYNNRFFLTTGFLNPIPSVPVYLSSLFRKILPFDGLMIARLPFALLNSFAPVLFFLILLHLSSNLPLSLISFFVWNFSPWFLHLSSTAAFDSPVALMFALLGLASLLKIKNKHKRVACFVLADFLAFNSYMGFKTVFPFFAILQFLIFFKSREKQGTNKQVLVKSILFASALFVFFTALINIVPNAAYMRTRARNNLVFLNKDTVENEIWYARLTTDGPEQLKRIFANKLFTPVYLFTSKYIRAFDLNSFFSGEPHVIYGLRIVGLFYMTDFALFMLGLLYFTRLLNKNTSMLLLVFFIGGLPFALNPEGFTAAIRGFLLIIPYVILISTGYYFCYKKNKILFGILSFVFVINVLSLLFLYQTRIKILSSESWHLTDKIVIEDLQKLKEPVDVYAFEPREFFLLYSFYSDINPASAKKQLVNTEAWSYKDTNLTFERHCDALTDPKNDNLILINPRKCDTEYKKKNYEVLKTYMARDMNGQALYLLARPVKN